MDNKLFGRENKILALNKSITKQFEAEAGMVMVKGFSGTGKTALVKMVVNNYEDSDKLFVSGKFEQYNRNEPYLAFTQIFSKIIRILLTKPKDVLKDYRNKILESLGEGVFFLVELVSELSLIVGNSVNKVELDPEKNKRRFENSCIEFLKIFLKNNNIVMFLDDLQWADKESLELLKSIEEHFRNLNLAIIGAYRIEELENSSNLFKYIKENSVTQLTVENLSIHDTSRMVCEIIGVNESDGSIVELCEYIYSKTIGNPFFIKELIKLIEDNAIISRNAKNIIKIKTNKLNKLEVKQQVIDIVIARFNYLGEDCIDVLKVASCIGFKFKSALLNKIINKDNLDDIIERLVKENIIIRKITEEEGYYQFIHDKVHQAIYGLINEEEVKENHYEIGSIILDEIEDISNSATILSAMIYINNALDRINIEDAKKYIRYNIAAGIKAKNTAAYESALKYFESAEILLTKIDADTYRKFEFEFKYEYGQAKYLTGQIESAHSIFDDLLKSIKDSYKKAEVLNFKSTLYMCEGKYKNALDIGLEALGNLGIYISFKNMKYQIAKEVIISNFLFNNKKINRLLSQKEATDKKIIKAAQIIIQLCSAAQLIDDKLFILMILKLANISAKHGNTKYAPSGYAGYAIFIGPIMGNYEKCEKLENIAIKLTNKYKDKSSELITKFIVGSLLTHWTKDVEISKNYLDESKNIGLESGDFLYAGYAITMYLETLYYTTEDVLQVYDMCLYYEEFADKVKIDIVKNITKIYKAGIAAITKTDSEATFNNNFEESITNETDLMSFLLLKGQYYYVIKKYEKALDIFKKMFKKKSLIDGFYILSRLYFYYNLVIIKNYKKFDLKEKRKYIKILNKNQKQLKKWAGNCSKNFMHLYLIIEAEKYRVIDDIAKAREMYSNAICYAIENNNIFEEALIHELAAEFYNDLENHSLTKAYITHSYACYNKYGAKLKTDNIKHHYELYFKVNKTIEEESRKDQINKKTYKNHYKGNSLTVELLNILEHGYENEEAINIAHHIIGTFKKLTRADKGYVLIEENEELYIENLENRINVEEYDEIAKCIVRYVSRSKDSIFENYDMMDEIFKNDKYILDNKISTICIPLVINEIFVGEVYLEKANGNFELSRFKEAKILAKQIMYTKAIQKMLEEDSSRLENSQKLEKNQINLTKAEFEILKLLVRGMTNKEISKESCKSLNTVKTQLKNIYGKLEVNRRVHAVSKAKELNLL